MSCTVRDKTLEQRWPTLNAKQKQMAQYSLNPMFSDLRRISFPSWHLCGVALWAACLQRNADN